MSPKKPVAATGYLKRKRMLDTITPSGRLVAPVRVHHSDDPEDILRFAIESAAAGTVAIATLVDIRGGAARPLGSNVVVTSDGRYCGYVSGGCVEAAVAAEALLAMEKGEDRLVKFGDGSPFFDIVLPCGGGISLAIHVVRDVTPLLHALRSMKERRPAGLVYAPREQTLTIATIPPSRSGWVAEAFVTVFRPKTRIFLAGQKGEAEAVGRIARAAGYDVIADDGFRTGLKPIEGIDPFTAVVLLYHDLDAEIPVLIQTLRSPAFYIGALGSTRTHKRRCDRLTASGFDVSASNRVKAPIGLFGPTRDSTSLSLSVLADIAAARLVAFG